jgi:hypothetical protein
MMKPKTFLMRMQDSVDIDYSHKHKELEPGTKDMIVRDSKSYFEKKDVILCRSGFQDYTYNEVLRFGIDYPKVKKDFYRVYRPASVLMSNLDKMTNIPITKEHPPEFIDGDNWQRYAHGYTGSEAEVVTLGDGDIGVKSKLVFSTSAIYNYYLDGNEEVSLGYTSRNRWVDNPESVGYDILMTGIEDVNHLAVTAAGRGGSRVSVIDSLIGGITMFKTGLFHFLKSKGKTADSATPFSKTVFDSLEASKNLSGEPLNQEVKRVLDSLATLKDGEKKTLLLDSVADCYKAIDTAMENKDSVSKFLDNAYKQAEDETVKTMDAAMLEDEDGKGKGTTNVSDAEEEKEKEKEEPKEEKKEEKKNEDSQALTMDSFTAVMDSAMKKFQESIEASMDERIQAGIKQALGLEPASKSSGGTVTDSVSVVPLVDIEKYVL